jgi:hypothetical protein
VPAHDPVRIKENWLLVGEQRIRRTKMEKNVLIAENKNFGRTFFPTHSHPVRIGSRASDRTTCRHDLMKWTGMYPKREVRNEFSRYIRVNVVPGNQIPNHVNQAQTQQDLFNGLSRKK